ENMADTAARTASERHIEGVRAQGGMFVEAVRVTRMPMVVTDATLPGNPITFANGAFIELSGYSMDELVGQDPQLSRRRGLARSRFDLDSFEEGKFQHDFLAFVSDFKKTLMPVHRAP